MVESLKELNKICQKPQYREVGNWMVRKVLRPAAIPITWLLLHTSVTANQVTGASILIGLAGNLCLAVPGRGFFLSGVLLLQLWYLLDHVDGQIARYRKTSGLTGRFYDFLMHHLIHGTLPFALGWHLYLTTRAEAFILLGFISSLSIIFFNMLYDIQYKAFFEKLLSSPQFIRKQGAEAVQVEIKPEKNIKIKLFAFFHKLIEMHVMMNTLTAAALFEFFLIPGISLRALLFPFYGLILPALALGKYVLWISQKRADKEFASLFINPQNQTESHE